MKKVFVNVKLSSLDFLGFRFGGAGLGNILFPWARGIIFAKKHSCKKINCTWTTIKFGTFLRKEKDKRTYHNIFKENEIKGLMKIFLLAFSNGVNEDDFKFSIENKRNTVVHFFGMKSQMKDILEDYTIVKEELYKIVRKKHLELAEKNRPKAIAVHIRLGDFQDPENEDIIRQGKTNCRLPIKWYVAIINNIRLEVGENVHVSVFSDGSNDQLKEILQLSNVSRVKNGTAISDMLSLSYAKVLIASNSTFSLWSSFIGRIPTIWFPGTNRIKLFFQNEDIFEGELDYFDEVPLSVINPLKR
jgi:hypothetical protein